MIKKSYSPPFLYCVSFPLPPLSPFLEFIQMIWKTGMLGEDPAGLLGCRENQNQETTPGIAEGGKALIQALASV